MPHFKYIALDAAGKVISGLAESPDREGIFLMLRQQGNKPLLVEGATAAIGGRLASCSPAKCRLSGR